MRLTEAFYRRLYSTHAPSESEEFYDKNQVRDKNGRWTRSGGGKSKTLEPTTNKIWSGVSAHPDRRTVPKSDLTFPIEKQDYELQREANFRFARSIYDSDLGDGYRSTVQEVEPFTSRGEMTIRGVLTHKGREIGYFDRTITVKPKGEVTVDHTELMIDGPHRSKGLGDRFNSHAVARYQEMGFDNITLHAGDAVGGFAWARQGFRWATPELGKKYGNQALDLVDATTKHQPTISATEKEKIYRETKALRKALDAGEDVQPIHIASIGEKGARWEAGDDVGMRHQSWPGKRAMLNTSWIGVYYFDANNAVTAAAMSLEHAALRPQFTAFAAAEPKQFTEAEEDNLWPRSGSHHLSLGRWLGDEEFGFNPAQPRDKAGKWTTRGAVTFSKRASEGKASYLAAHGLPADTTDYSTVSADAGFRRKIAKQMAGMPDDDPAVHDKYDKLVGEIEQQYDYMTNTLGIKVSVTPGDPYPSIKEMVADVESGHLSVLATATTGSHPYLTDVQNDKFRAVHDFFGHAGTGRDFNRHGERATYLSHASMMQDKDSVRALFTETEAQAAHVVYFQEYAGQKVAVFPDADVFYGLDKVLTAAVEFAFNSRQPRDKEGQWTRAGVRVESIRGDIKRERNAVLKELDDQGVDPMNPLRHIFETRMGDKTAVVRDGDGKVVGGVQYLVSKQWKEITVTDMRMSQERQGHGTTAFQHIAREAADAGYALKISGAVNSAKPFYAGLGAIFQTNSGQGQFTTEARDALAAGKPIKGAVLDYNDWVQVDF